MENIDPEEPVYELHVNGKHVATLCAPRWEGMFWCSYRIKPMGADASRVLRDTKLWETVNFTIRDSHGAIPNQHTFSGGYADFCDGKTDRLTFRSLWPPRPQRLTLFLAYSKTPAFGTLLTYTGNDAKKECRITKRWTSALKRVLLERQLNPFGRGHRRR